MQENGIYSFKMCVLYGKICITVLLKNYYNFINHIDKKGKKDKILSMRVISGVARGTKIESIESLSTRPTLDRVKESLFNILQNEIKDKIVLDLFAGSGAIRNRSFKQRS